MPWDRPLSSVKAVERNTAPLFPRWQSAQHRKALLLHALLLPALLLLWLVLLPLRFLQLMLVRLTRTSMPQRASDSWKRAVSNAAASMWLPATAATTGSSSSSSGTCTSSSSPSAAEEASIDRNQNNSNKVYNSGTRAIAAGAI